ncbi:MAG: hypothetical protein U9N81_04465 [Bacillota bacterium]|nr:hypothetical protein [Bacillota bacterium]
MEDLQAYPAQPMRFYLSDMSPDSDRLPDQGDIQWAPFPVVSKNRSAIAVTCIIWMAITVFFYRHRLWVFYYIWGSIGLCCVMVLLFHASFVEYQVKKFTSMMLHYVLSSLGIVTYLFDKAPGTLLVLIKVDASWTTIAIDIENSGLVEMCILFSVLIFYLVFAWRKRFLVALTGIMGIYGINLIRLLIVITLIHSKP